MTEKLKDEAIVAAKWWADRFREGPKFDNGDQSETGFMTMILANMVYQAPTRESIEHFEAVLQRKIHDSLVEFGGLCLNVDYGPDLLLRAAANEAGFSSNAEFPWKTYMHIELGSVRVSYGYGAPYKELMSDV